MEALVSRRVDVDGVCPLCGFQGESVDHIFLWCRYDMSMVEGAFIAVKNERIHSPQDSLLAEALACKEALSWLKERGIFIGSAANYIYTELLFAAARETKPGRATRTEQPGNRPAVTAASPAAADTSASAVCSPENLRLFVLF
ncbi:unnamed protein product [Cuscuta campestris]|uniref:Uncharacterized protein n=1 Tax=Cuscuta campestris TaxID=132261 RepID=A0A484MJ89_9ASTE|nr:unnamed protein product [Cuscuta campestris]